MIYTFFQQGQCRFISFAYFRHLTTSVLRKLDKMEKIFCFKVICSVFWYCIDRAKAAKIKGRVYSI